MQLVGGETADGPPARAGPPDAGAEAASVTFTPYSVVNVARASRDAPNVG